MKHENIIVNIKTFEYVVRTYNKHVHTSSKIIICLLINNDTYFIY